MNIKNMTFGQLYRIYSSRNLCSPATEQALARTPELREALRRAADAQTLPTWPGALTQMRVCMFYDAATEKDAYGLATIQRVFIEQSGVRAKIVREPGAFIVWAETNVFGALVLFYRSGCTLHSLQQFCIDGDLNFSEIFWWVSLAGPVAGENTINPLRRCLNTPDVQENAKALVNAP